MSIEDAELLREFAVESQEHLSDIENQLLTLESQGDNMDVALVNTVFRAIHSIKGAAGFMGLDTLGGLAHRAEEVLNKLRNNELRPTSVVINTLLKAADRLKDLIDQIETSNDADVSDHLAALELILSGESDVAVITCPPVVEPIVAPYVPEPQVLCEEALREFLVECYDNLEQIERDLLTLERDPKSESILNSVFRNIHTIKGSAGFLAYATLERVAHTTENVLGSVRSGAIPMDSEVSECMFKSIDAIRKILKSIESVGNDGSDPFSSLISDIESLHIAKLVDAKSPPAAPKKPSVSPASLPTPVPSSISATPIAHVPTAQPAAAVKATSTRIVLSAAELSEGAVAVADVPFEVLVFSGTLDAKGAAWLETRWIMELNALKFDVKKGSRPKAV